MFAGHLGGALKAPELASHLGPRERGRCWALRASACRRKGSTEEAIDAWKQAFELSSDDSWVLSRFAIWQLHQYRYVDALDTAIQGVELASTDDQPLAYQVRGQALWLCGFPQQALPDFAEAAQRARVNSPVQLCAVVSIAVALAHSPLATAEAGTLVLELASGLRAKMGTRPLPRVRALLRWATGLAECARGRTSAGARDLYRARQTFIALGDVSPAAAITFDYAKVANRPVEPLLSEILDEAPVDAEEQVIAYIEGIVSGRISAGSQRNQLASLALTSSVRRRSEI